MSSNARSFRFRQGRSPRPVASLDEDYHGPGPGNNEPLPSREEQEHLRVTINSDVCARANPRKVAVPIEELIILRHAGEGKKPILTFLSGPATPSRSVIYEKPNNTTGQNESKISSPHHELHRPHRDLQQSSRRRETYDTGVKREERGHERPRDHDRLRDGDRSRDHDRSRGRDRSRERDRSRDRGAKREWKRDDTERDNKKRPYKDGKRNGDEGGSQDTQSSSRKDQDKNSHSKPSTSSKTETAVKEEPSENHGSRQDHYQRSQQHPDPFIDYGGWPRGPYPSGPYPGGYPVRLPPPFVRPPPFIRPFPPPFARPPYPPPMRGFPRPPRNGR